MIELTTEESGLSFEQVCDRHKPTYILAGAVYRDGDHMAITDQLLSLQRPDIRRGRSHDMEPTGSSMGPLVDDIVQKVLLALPKDVQPEHQSKSQSVRGVPERAFSLEPANHPEPDGGYFFFSKGHRIRRNLCALLRRVGGLLRSFGIGSLYGSAAERSLSERRRPMPKKHFSWMETWRKPTYRWHTPRLCTIGTTPEAEEEFKKAIELRPGYATAHQYYAYYLTAMGDLNQAIAERKLAVSIDPRSPLLNTALGEEYYHARQFKESIGPNQKALRLTRTMPWR